MMTMVTTMSAAATVATNDAGCMKVMTDASVGDDAGCMKVMTDADL